MVAGSACIGGIAGFIYILASDIAVIAPVVCDIIGVTGIADTIGSLAIGWDPLWCWCYCWYMLVLVVLLVLLVSSYLIGIQFRSICLVVSRPIYNRDIDSCNILLY